MEAANTPPPLLHDEEGAKLPRPSAKLQLTCNQCDRTYEAYPSDLKRGRMNYCSKKCSSAARRKRKSIEFDGVVFVCDHNGYYIARRLKRMLHRAIWEKHHGLIPEGYRVYFKDKNRDNLAIDNLYLKERNANGRCDECGNKIHARGKCVYHYAVMRERERSQTSSNLT